MKKHSDGCITVQTTKNFLDYIICNILTLYIVFFNLADPMAVEKLSDGINKFAADITKL